MGDMIYIKINELRELEFNFKEIEHRTKLEILNLIKKRSKFNFAPMFYA